ncbi:hypothetical protein U27_04617 [Candidatus Vecturithrix granuli]|uniref:VWA containing CoxE family protein n=1 Tax=Vecturithrix granuli TaxID=1499967 RepID=A0A081BZ95_VECG1|nr:hypothetical protein U27_04617 [Candidatus Vecturithrix granuli]
MTTPHSTSKPETYFLWPLFQQLRRRHFPLGPDDYDALRQAIRAGFGWRSRRDLRNLCCRLWAKSRQERTTLFELFEQYDVPDWDATPFLSAGAAQKREPGASKSLAEPPAAPETPTGAESVQIVAEARGDLPEIIASIEFPQEPVVLTPQLPLTYREVAQAWRRLRQPVRTGPAIDLDLDATIARRCRLGIAAEVVLTPRRRNTARLLLLVDRQGSMTPFHALSAEVCLAIEQAGNLERVAFYYFHDVPAEGADESVLHGLDQLFPTLDTVFAEIEPLQTGTVYADPQLLQPRALEDVLAEAAQGAAVVILSDAGAARGRYDLLRLLDTVAFLKALQSYTRRFVWLNPLPRKYWAHSTAEQIQRYVPMFALDRAGMYRAVNVLRGKPITDERMERMGDYNE